uniref:Uncharacterized protein n=1 Tax=Rhizophora mucronata TaxID=61149 RepID=A0A2P2K5D1_RHIMU
MNVTQVQLLLKTLNFMVDCSKFVALYAFYAFPLFLTLICVCILFSYS